jgi:hypothetical protein
VGCISALNFSTGCSSMLFGATPTWGLPCFRSKKPTPRADFVIGKNVWLLRVLSGKHSSGMGDEASGGEAYLYVISCGLKRAKIGVARYASSTDPLLSSLSSFRQKATRELCLSRSPRAAGGSSDAQPGSCCGIRARETKRRQRAQSAPSSTPTPGLAVACHRRRTFEHVAALLRPGGRFAWARFSFQRSIKRTDRAGAAVLSTELRGQLGT